MNTGMSICAQDCEMWTDCLHVTLHLEHRACKRISRSISSCSSAGDSHTEGATVLKSQMMSEVQTNSCPTLQTKNIRNRICMPILQYLHAVCCCCCKSPPLTKRMRQARTHAQFKRHFVPTLDDTEDYTCTSSQHADDDAVSSATAAKWYGEPEWSPTCESQSCWHFKVTLGRFVEL